MNQVVDEDSAILGVPREVIIPINADHRSMCRFFSANSQKYFPINSAIVEMANRAIDRKSACPKLRKFYQLPRGSILNNPNFNSHKPEL